MKKRFIVEIEDKRSNISELKDYIYKSIDTWRGSMHPDDFLQDFKIISVKYEKSKGRLIC